MLQRAFRFCARADAMGKSAAEQYRQTAEEIRQVAQRTRFPEIRDELFELAKLYDRLAAYRANGQRRLRSLNHSPGIPGNMPDQRQTSPRPLEITIAQERALVALLTAPNPRDGLAISLVIGAGLARRGWAEPGSHYPLFRITDAGRQALSEAKTARLKRTGVFAT